MSQGKGDSKKIGWGIVGAGLIADGRFAPAINKDPGSELVAVCNRDAGKAAAFAEKHGAQRSYDDPAKLFEDEGVQAVYIATPNYQHCEQVVAAADRGKHVLCEKPMAMSVEEADEMISACRKNEVMLQLAFNMRFHACNREMRSLIGAGRIGRPLFAKAELILTIESLRNPDQWRHDPALPGGGAIMDVGTHFIDILGYVMDARVEEVTATLPTLAYDSPNDDTALLHLKFDSGAYGVVTIATYVPYYSNILEVSGTEGALRARNPTWQASASRSPKPMARCGPTTSESTCKWRRMNSGTER